MFIKSNPTAFPHIMHFLLHNLDPPEFAHRFLWPLHSDKAVEKEFRQKCVKYINDLRKKYNMDLEEVGQYIVVVPGGHKFMKVLLELIKLLQMETLKSHNRTEWLDLPAEEIFSDEIRAEAQQQFECLQRVHQEINQAAQKELKRHRKKTEIIKYYIKELETHLEEAPNENLDDTLQREVKEICGKMEQVMRLVSDLEKTCGSSPDQHSNPFERLHLSNAISRIVEHHKWILKPDEYTHKINCSSILDIASRIMRELVEHPIQVADVNPIDLVNQNHDLEIFLRNVATVEGDLQLLQHNIRVDEQRHKDHEMLHPKERVVFPERDYPLVEMQSCDLSSLYEDLQRRSETLPQPYRLALEDVIPESVVMSPPTTGGKHMNTSHRDRSITGLMMTSRKHSSQTARKKTQAMSVLKTISRSSKRTKVNMEALKELARNGFNESMLDSSTITWKKKSVNLSTRTETSGTETTIRGGATGTATRLSALFSDSMMPKFNSTSIFNSTTNEQAQQLVFSDITNKEPTKETVTAPALAAEERSILKQFREIKLSVEEEQENLLDCSDSVLIN